MDLLHPPGRGRREPVVRHGPTPLRRDRRPLQEMGRRQRRRLLLLRAHRPLPHLPVAVQPGDAVYLSLTVYGGPDDGRYSERIVGTVNNRDAGWTPDGTFDLVLSPERPAEAGWPGYGSSPTPWRDHPRLPRGPANRPAGPVAHRGRDPPDTYREDDADLARRSGPWRPGCASRPASCPSPRRAEHRRPAVPVPTTTFGWAAGDAAYAMGAFALDDDEALVIQGRSPECAFWNMCLWNSSSTPTTTTTSGSRSTAPRSSTNPMAPGRSSSARRARASELGLDRRPRSGRIWFRWFLPSDTPDHRTSRSCR